MMSFLEKAKRFLWAFVELGFLVVLAVILIYLLLGENSGEFVQSVAANVIKFTQQVAAANLIGIAVLLAIIWLAVQRAR
jgi:hypothetical protein